MRIGIVLDPVDDAVADSSARAGIFNYTYQLTSALLRSDTRNEYILIHYKKDAADLYSRTDELIVPMYSLPLWHEIRKAVLLPIMTRNRMEVIHETRAFSPFLFSSKMKKVLTVHDLSTFLFPEVHTALNAFRVNNSFAVSVKKVDKIIAVSNTTKIDLIRMFQIPESKIVVVYEAANENFKPSKNTDFVKKKYGIAQDYILSVGTLEPRKNIGTLLKAYYMLRKMGINHKLVIVGARGWKFGLTEITKIIANLELADEVHVLGFVPENDLPAIYSASSLFAFPSIYEGFGLPALEAMSCGTPVIASNTSALPEVVGDAAITIDPLNIEQLASAMYRVLTDVDLTNDMISKGLARARMFSWQKAAMETAEIYESVG